MDIETANEVLENMGRSVDFGSIGRGGVSIPTVAVDGMDFTAEELEALLTLLRARGQE